jgi:hypothetical protein
MKKCRIDDGDGGGDDDEDAFCCDFSSCRESVSCDDVAYV